MAIFLQRHMPTLHCHGHFPFKVYIALTIAVKHSLWTPTTCSCRIGLWQKVFWPPGPFSTVLLTHVEPSHPLSLPGSCVYAAHGTQNLISP